MSEPERKRTDLHEAIDSKDWSAVSHITEDHPEWLSVREDKFGYTPLLQLLKSKDTIPSDVVAEIANKTPTSLIDIQNENGWTALQLAAQHGFVEAVNVLISRGANKDIQMKKGVTALFVSAQNGHTDICKILIDSGADMHIQQEDGWTTLMTAAHFNKYDTVKLLIKYNVNVNQVNTDGGTALHAAAFLGYSSVVKLLLDAGALLLQTKDGNTPLHSCFLNSNLSYDQHRKVAVAFMMTSRSDIVSIKNKKEKTAIQLYREHKCQKYVKKRMSEQKEEILQILKGGSLPVINFTPSGRSIPSVISAHGPAADQVYIKALEEGAVEVNLGRIKVIGQERVGKTCLINACLGKPFNSDEKTTNAIATTKIVTKTADEPSKWGENLTNSGSATEMYQRLMAETVIRDIVENCGAEKIEETPSEKRKNAPVTPTENLHITREMSDTEAGSSKEERIRTEVGLPREKTNVLETEPKMPMMPMEIKKQVDEGFRKGIYYKKQGLGEWHNIGEETFNIWDYGGQVIYHGIHKIFMTFMAVYIVVFNLDVSLDEHAIVQDSSGKKYPHHLTNLEFLIYWIQSVYTHSRQLIDDIEQEIDLPAIVLVGTHRDSLGDNEEERERKVEEAFTKINKALEGAPYESHVYHEYFDIENDCPEIDKNVFELKNVLEILMKTLIKPVPLKWMHFRCELQQLRDEDLVCSLRKVKELATTCGIDDEEQLNVLLNFLYDLGEIIYMPDNDALKDKVILDPMEFVGVVKTVITVIPPKLRTAKFRASMRKLDLKGILEEGLLRNLWRKSGIDLKNVDTFVELMKQFSFLCDRKTSEASDGARSFFVPLRLALEPPSSDKQRQVDSYGTRAISIYHGFCGYLPDELFPMIVTEFINTFEGEEEPELAHDRAELYFDQYHHVVLSVVMFNRQRMLKTTIIRREAINEAKISLDREPSSIACKTVLNFLEASFKRSQQGSRRGIKYERCIPCFCSKNSTENVHIQKLGKFEKKMLSCGRDGMYVVRYQRLFGDPSEAAPKEETCAKDPSEAAPKEETCAKGFGVEESEFTEMLVRISNDIEDLTIWKVALSDHIKNVDALQKAKRAIHLFDALIDSEDLKAWDIRFLLETIKLTNVLRLRENIPHCPCLKNLEITYFSIFRQSVVEFGMDLTERDIGSIAFSYKAKLPSRRYGSDKWSLIMDLERSLILADDDASFDAFKSSLDKMELGQLNKWLKR